jgi:hypothetical protein
MTGLTGETSLNFEPGTLNFRAPSSVRYPCKSAADLSKFARQLDPPFAAVGAGEELSVVAARENQVGVGRVGREAFHVGVWCDGQQRRFPRVTAVRRALYRTEAAEGVVADSRQDYSRIVRFKRYAPAVRQGKFAADAQCLPIHSAIRADADLIGESDYRGSRFTWQRFDVMNIGLVHEPAGWTRPCVTAVLAHADAVDFDSRPDKLML